MSRIVPYFLNTVTWRFNIQKTGCCSSVCPFRLSLELILDARVVCFTMELQWGSQDNVMLLPFKSNLKRKERERGTCGILAHLTLLFKATEGTESQLGSLTLTRGKSWTESNRSHHLLVVGFYFITFFEQLCIN